MPTGSGGSLVRMPLPTTILPPGAALVLGRQIRERRLALGMTRSQLVISAGCSLSFLENVESGAGPRRSSVIPQVLEALDQAEAAAAKASADAALACPVPPTR